MKKVEIRTRRGNQTQVSKHDCKNESTRVHTPSHTELKHTTEKKVNISIKSK